MPAHVAEKQDRRARRRDPLGEVIEVDGQRPRHFHQHRLGPDATVTTVVPDGVRQHVVGVTLPSPYSH